MMIQNRKSCYCAFCKNPRKVYSSRNLNLWGVISLVILSYLMTLAIWQEPDLRGLFIAGGLLFLAEFFTQIRWRQSMICSHCGFDPVVYVKDPAQAASKINDFMKFRSEKPEFLLKPTLQLPKRKGQNLSLRG